MSSRSSDATLLTAVRLSTKLCAGSPSRYLIVVAKITWMGHLSSLEIRDRRALDLCAVPCERSR